MSTRTNLIGVEAGIDHGTMRGYRQHNHRGVPLTDSCGCREACREDAAAHRAAKGTTPRTSRTAQEWNRGQVGQSRPASAPVPAGCSQPDCGTEAVGRPMPDGWEGATVDGVRRRFCRAWCATYAQALADVRSIPGPEVAS